MSHITYQQRYTISCMLTQGYNQSRIGEAIGKHKSVISREIKRNKDLRNGERLLRGASVEAKRSRTRSHHSVSILSI